MSESDIAASGGIEVDSRAVRNRTVGGSGPTGLRLAIGPADQNRHSHARRVPNRRTAVGIEGSPRSSVRNLIGHADRGTRGVHAPEPATLTRRRAWVPRQAAADRRRRAVRQASRMETIGTESAFEVAARARALEATGRERHPPPDRRARLRHAGERPRGGQARARRRLRRTTRRSRASPTLREAIADDATARKGFPVDPGPRLRHGRRQGRDALRDPRR